MKQNTFQVCGHHSYFLLTIDQRINARQHRNSLNINHLFATVIRQDSSHLKQDSDRPKVNNGLYHHTGKNHSKYPL